MLEARMSTNPGAGFAKIGIVGIPKISECRIFGNQDYRLSESPNNRKLGWFGNLDVRILGNMGIMRSELGKICISRSPDTYRLSRRVMCHPIGWIHGYMFAMLNAATCKAHDTCFSFDLIAMWEGNRTKKQIDQEWLSTQHCKSMLKVSKNLQE